MTKSCALQFGVIGLDLRRLPKNTILTTPLITFHLSEFKEAKWNSVFHKEICIEELTFASYLIEIYLMEK